MRQGNNRIQKLKRLLVVGWALFILLAAVFFLFFFKNLPIPSNGVDSKYTYETNANLDINALMISYFSGLAACDQSALKECVTDPSEFDDMSDYQQKATMITGYRNIDCYTIPGLTEDATIVYVVFNPTIVGVNSTPKDIYCFYVLYQDGSYKIDNRTLSEEVASYVASVTKWDDVQALYQMVKEDEDRCLAEDPTFYEFTQKLINNEALPDVATPAEP